MSLLKRKKKIEEEVKEEEVVEEVEAGGDAEEDVELVIEEEVEAIEEKAAEAPASEFRVGNKVRLKAMVDYGGRRLEDVEDEVYTIYAIEGDKVQLRYGRVIFFVKITNLIKE